MLCGRFASGSLTSIAGNVRLIQRNKPRSRSMLRATNCVPAHAVPVAAAKARPSSVRAGPAIMSASIRFRLAAPTRRATMIYSHTLTARYIHAPRYGSHTGAQIAARVSPVNSSGLAAPTLEASQAFAGAGANAVARRPGNHIPTIAAINDNVAAMPIAGTKPAVNAFGEPKLPVAANTATCTADPEHATEKAQHVEDAGGLPDLGRRDGA